MKTLLWLGVWFFGVFSNLFTDTTLQTISVPTQHQFELKLSQTASLHGTPYSIMFLNVAEDTRCPIDKRCLWPGNGSIEIMLLKDNRPVDTMMLNTYTEPEALVHSGFEFRPKGLSPSPKTTREISRSAYRATLYVKPLAE